MTIGLVTGLVVQAGAAMAQDESPKNEPPKKIKDLVVVTVHTPEAAIDDLRGGTVIVHIDNSGRRPISLLEVEAHLAEDEVAPDSEGIAADDRAEAAVTFEARRSTTCLAEGDAVFPCVVAPGSQATVPIEVTVHSLARTGKVLVTVEVRVERAPKGGVAKQATLVVVESLALGIFGEAELSPLLQIPSILVLPGTLFLVVILVLWRLGARPLDKKPEEFYVSSTGIEFWLSAVAVSMVIGLLWRCLYGRNLLKGYGYRDIGGVLVVAAVMGVVCAGYLKTSRMLALKREKDRRIEAGDTAKVALAKLAKRDEPETLELPSFSHNGRGMLLYTKDDGSGTPIVGDVLRYLIEDEDSEVEAELSSLVNKNRVAALARRLDELVSQKKVRVVWGGEKPVAGPKEYKIENWRRAIESHPDQ